MLRCLDQVHRITVEMVRTCVVDREAANVANKTINLELGILRGLMKRAKLWHHLSDEIKPCRFTLSLAAQ